MEDLGDRSSHPHFVKKKKVRIQATLLNGLSCQGDCHVVWPDGRVSDVINDDRPFLILTNVQFEGEDAVYDVLTINKSQIGMFFEGAS